VREGRFCEPIKKRWRGTCERLEWGGSGTGVSVKRKRDHTVAWEDMSGSAQVKQEFGNGEGKRWITGCEKIVGWRARTKRVVSPSE